MNHRTRAPLRQALVDKLALQFLEDLLTTAEQRQRHHEPWTNLYHQYALDIAVTKRLLGLLREEKDDLTCGL